MKQLLLACIACFTILIANGQAVDSSAVQVNGRVFNASTDEPVDARITYESLPYGSKIGIFTGATFSFTLKEGKDYKLLVTAEGFAPYHETIRYNEAEGGIIEKPVPLQPTGVNRLIRLEKLIFALGKAKISEASYEELDELVAMLKNNENMQIQLEGHTDFRGNEKLNMKLSEERVEAVKDYLVSKGISKRRIKTKAFGGSRPLSREDDAESRRRNRRVEVRILSN